MDQEVTRMVARSQSVMRIVLRGALLVAIGWLATLGWKHRAWFHPQVIRDWIAQFGAAGLWIYVFLYAANTITLLPPIAVLSLTAGLAFGPHLGFLAILVGAMIGTSVTFWISRRLGRGFVEGRLKGRFKSLDEKLEKNGFATVFFFRLVPVVPYEVLNYTCGLSQIRFRDYGLATFLGILPGAAVSAYFGDSLTQPFSKRFLLALAALVVLIAVPVIYLKVRRNRGHATD